VGQAINYPALIDNDVESGGDPEPESSDHDRQYPENA
jgi:hypothetical protein